MTTDEFAALRSRVNSAKALDVPFDRPIQVSLGDLSRLLAAAEERDRLRILNNIRNHRLISERARAERLAALLRETETTIRVTKGNLGEHTEARGMLEGQINKIRAALAAEPETKP